MKMCLNWLLEPMDYMWITDYEQQKISGQRSENEIIFTNLK